MLRLLLQRPNPSYHTQDTHVVSPKRSHLKEVALLALPTIFDLIATVLMNVGLLYVTASVYQMMRGAEMLFAAFFAITFLGRKLNRYHALGIVCCVVSDSVVLGGEGRGTRAVGKGFELRNESTHTGPEECNIWAPAVDVS